MKTALRILVLYFALACVEPMPREVHIEHTSPVADSIANERLFFAFVIYDSYGRPDDLTGTMRVNQGEDIVCRGKREWRSTVESEAAWSSSGTGDYQRSGWEYVFRCPYEIERLGDGEHEVWFGLQTKDLDPEENKLAYIRMRKEINFTYDGTPPDIHAAWVRTESGTATVVWNVDARETGIEVEGYRRGVRMFSSRAHQGSLALARDMLPSGSTLELRVWDAHGNRAIRELSVP